MVVYEHTDETQIKFALMWKEIFASFIWISNIYKIFPFAQPNLHRTKTFFQKIVAIPQRTHYYYLNIGGTS